MAGTIATKQLSPTEPTRLDPNARIDLALNRRVHQATPVIAFAIGALYLFHAGVDFWLPGDKPLYPQYIVVASILIAYSFALPRWRMPQDWAHPLTALVVLMILGNTLLAMYRAHNPLETTTVLVLMVGAGCVFLSLRWLLGMLCVIVLGWAIVAIEVCGPEHWRHFIFSIVTAFAVSIILHAVRYHTIRWIELMRVESDRKNRQLSRSLKNLENEISVRQRVELELKQARDELEERVEERTHQLENAHEELLMEIAERYQAAERARQLQGELEHLNRVSSMGEMASAMSHEITQPLAIITNYARACLRGKESQTLSEAEVDKSLNSIAEQAMRCGEIIQRIKAYMAKSPPERSTFDANAAIEEICLLLESEAKELSVDLEMRLGDQLPPVAADRVQLQQIMVNLVRNAFDAMNDVPQEERRVMIETDVEDDAVRVSVTDTGEGIPAEISDNVFAPYFSTKSSGLGMGLSISRGIVEAHGGRMWASCPAAGGTKFQFTLPVAAKEMAHV